MIMGSEPATVPPSPSLPVPGFDALSMTPASSKRKGRSGQENRKHNAQTGAGVVKKTQPKKKMAGDTVAKLVDFVTPGKAAEMTFRFMDLPGGMYPSRLP